MRFDIFCRVIDNFGDIGVCWRLARHLTARSPQHHITLWVDDIGRFQSIEPAVKHQAVQSLTPSITLVHWTPDVSMREPGDVVIEAFSCDPPPAFVRAMAARNSLWINLEYLSAESWVEGCHGLPSLQPDSLRKFFYFPGFTTRTGGLLREDGLLQKRNRWLQQPAKRWELLRHLGVPGSAIESLQTTGRLAFLFGYPSAPVHALINALAESQTHWVLLIPEGLYPEVQSPADTALQVVRIPFVTQDDFDTILWSSDLNFVRGEDSVIRALWAGKPLVWQIYEQEERAHIIKLRAWLASSPYPESVHSLMLNWNTGQTGAAQSSLANLIDGPTWEPWKTSAMDWAEQLANQPALAASLEAFCAKNWQTR